MRFNRIHHKDMSTQSIGRKSKELLVIAILFNIAAIGWYGFLFAKIKEKNEHLSDLTNQIDAEIAKESAVDYKKNIAVETATLRGKLLSFTLAKEGAISFIELLEATGNEVGAHTSIKSVNTEDHPQSSNIEKLRLTLSTSGSWSAVARFLGLLELLPYETSLEQVMVSRAEVAGENPWRADLILTVLKEK